MQYALLALLFIPAYAYIPTPTFPVVFMTALPRPAIHTHGSIRCNRYARLDPKSVKRVVHHVTMCSAAADLSLRENGSQRKPLRLPNLSQVEHLDELLAIIRPYIATFENGEGDEYALESWEAALAMNHISRLHKKHRRQGEDKNSLLATRQLARLAEIVIHDAETLKPKGLSWALNACSVFPLTASSHASMRGTTRERASKEDGIVHASAPFDEVMIALVHTMLDRLPRLQLAQERVGVQNLAIFAAAVAVIEERTPASGSQRASTLSNQANHTHTGKMSQTYQNRLAPLVSLALAEGDESWSSKGPITSLIRL